VKDIFRMSLQTARQVESRCSVLFFDEIDALGQNRSEQSSGEGNSCSRRVLAELLTQLNYISHHQGQFGENNLSHEDSDEKASMSSLFIHARVIVVAATNRPEDCDPALLRRFGIRLKVDLPTKRERRKMFMRHLHPIEHTISVDGLEDISELTEGFSGSDIENLTREAVMAPVRECIRTAAKRKRQSKAAKERQAGGDVSCQENDKLSSCSPDVCARSILMESLQKLRPVTIDDFDCALKLWLGCESLLWSSQNQSLKRSRQSHFDSSSSDDDYDQEVCVLE
jgi:SpoVK/Ycf46/Vps4 family AAA+-type ATPase